LRFKKFYRLHHPSAFFNGFFIRFKNIEKCTWVVKSVKKGKALPNFYYKGYKGKRKQKKTTTNCTTTMNGQRNDLLVPRVLSKLVIRRFNF
jgi:hypothetical protein